MERNPCKRRKVRRRNLSSQLKSPRIGSRAVVKTRMIGGERGGRTLFHEEGMTELVDISKKCGMNYLLSIHVLMRRTSNFVDRRQPENSTGAIRVSYTLPQDAGRPRYPKHGNLEEDAKRLAAQKEDSRRNKNVASQTQRSGRVTLTGNTQSRPIPPQGAYGTGSSRPTQFYAQPGIYYVPQYATPFAMDASPQDGFARIPSSIFSSSSSIPNASIPPRHDASQKAYTSSNDPRSWKQSPSMPNYSRTQNAPPFSSNNSSNYSSRAPPPPHTSQSQSQSQTPPQASQKSHGTEAKPTKSHYEVLGVSPTAERAEIKKAYTKLALAHHSDRDPKATEESAEIWFAVNNAWEIQPARC
jgi:hypothetical protein